VAGDKYAPLHFRAPSALGPNLASMCAVKTYLGTGSKGKIYREYHRAVPAGLDKDDIPVTSDKSDMKLGSFVSPSNSRYVSHEIYLLYIRPMQLSM
jgi:hypothetical protein